MNTRWLALAVAALLAPAAALAAFDRTDLYKHLPKALPFPPGVKFMLRDLKPSTLPGFLTGVLDAEYKGQSQSFAIQISEDGHYYILSDVYTPAASSLPEYLKLEGPQTNMQVSKDGKHYLLGDFQDLRVDPDKENLSKIHLEGVPFRGGAHAPLLFVEYSDLECPYCREAHIALEKDLLAAYGNKIKWIYKFNPLPMHKWAYPAAIAAACATRQKPEIGWKLEAAIYEQQESIKPDVAPADLRTRLLDLAGKSGADETKFAACYDKQETKQVVDADLKEAHDLGLNSTPSFVVNGRIIHGFRNFPLLKDMLDGLLAEKSAK